MTGIIIVVNGMLSMIAEQIPDTHSTSSRAADNRYWRGTYTIKCLVIAHSKNKFVYDIVKQTIFYTQSQVGSYNEYCLCFP